MIDYKIEFEEEKHSWIEQIVRAHAMYANQFMANDDQKLDHIVEILTKFQEYSVYRGGNHVEILEKGRDKRRLILIIKNAELI